MKLYNTAFNGRNENRLLLTNYFPDEEEEEEEVVGSPLAQHPFAQISFLPFYCRW